MNVIFLGSAASGKTSLCHAYGTWLLNQHPRSVSYINLDPGVEYLPFLPKFDLRDYFTISQIMKQEQLGPNGAMLKANEFLFNKKDQILRSIFKEKSDFMLFDTPGQLEIFVFQETGRLFLQELQEYSPTIAIYLLDATLASSVSNLIVNLLLALAVQIQLGIEMIYILHKSDLLLNESKVKKMIEDPTYLRNSIINQNLGSITGIALAAQRGIAELLPSMRLITTSIKPEPSGLEELHDLLHETFCACGDLT
ncbi:MAG: hypothetical protein EU536_00500 [Promethearchaeota archaeon]|nr:MAG: hypothetical protein EU536_00500 [Candidatus Lokiarchaeota archaeon]